MTPVIDKTAVGMAALKGVDALGPLAGLLVTLGVGGTHTIKRAKKRQLPSDLPCCVVTHDLSDEQEHCSCDLTVG